MKTQDEVATTFLDKKQRNRDHKFYFYIAVVVMLWVSLELPVLGQTTEKPVTNNTIVEMTKAGLSDEIIIAKIRTSSVEFDTSTAALAELKKLGVSEAVIVSMIGRAVSGTRLSASKQLEMSDAVGKKRIFVDCLDDKSKLEILKVIKKRGYRSVLNEADAQIVFRFSFETSNFQFGMTEIQQKNGKLAVFLYSGDESQLIWVKQRDAQILGKPLHKQAKDYSEDFLDDMERLEERNE